MGLRRADFDELSRVAGSWQRAARKYFYCPLPAAICLLFPHRSAFLSLSTTVVPSGTMLWRGRRANGPITHSDPMLESRPMNVNGWITVSGPTVTPSSRYVWAPLTMVTPSVRSFF
jgi:hypothetical protein